MNIARHLASAGIIALSLASTSANALDKNWYLGLRGGVVFPEERRFFSTDPTQLGFQTREARGWAAAARLGYDFGMLRTEVDVGYHQNNVRSIELLSTSPAGEIGTFNGPNGKLRNWTIMANALIDIINTDRFSVSAGAGAGTARVDVHNYRLTTGSDLLLNDSDWVFAWNALAGARVALSDRVDLALDYRYLRPNRARFTDTGGAGVNTRRASHTALVGLNFNFGAGREVIAEPQPAPPPPAPAPAPMEPVQPQPAPQPIETPPPPPPAPAGPIMVFFDFDRAILTAEAKQIVAQAADPARQMGTSRLSVEGHADRSGSGPYNAALGLRRAQAVQRELETMGIDPTRIAIQSFGEDRSLVETVDGQREPQNRRVEITVQPR